MDPKRKLKPWRNKFFPVNEKVIMDEDRPANIITLAKHGMKVKEKGNANTHSRARNRR